MCRTQVYLPAIVRQRGQWYCTQWHICPVECNEIEVDETNAPMTDARDQSAHQIHIIGN